MTSFHLDDFQAKCEDAWESYDACANATLLAAYMAGFQNVIFPLNGSLCKFDFLRCTEHDLGTGRLRYFSLPHCGPGGGSGGSRGVPREVPAPTAPHEASRVVARGSAE